MEERTSLPSVDARTQAMCSCGQQAILSWAVFDLQGGFDEEFILQLRLALLTSSNHRGMNTSAEEDRSAGF